MKRNKFNRYLSLFITTQFCGAWNFVLFVFCCGCCCCCCCWCGDDAFVAENLCAVSTQKFLWERENYAWHETQLWLVQAISQKSKRMISSDTQPFKPVSQKLSCLWHKISIWYTRVSWEFDFFLAFISNYDLLDLSCPAESHRRPSMRAPNGNWIAQKLLRVRINFLVSLYFNGLRMCLWGFW